MEQIKNLLETREKQLLQIKKEKEKALRKVPKGSLRICKRGEKAQYYHRNNPKDFNGVYIREKDIGLAVVLQIIYGSMLHFIYNHFQDYPECHITLFKPNSAH